jgi:hypothetical protein
MGEPVPISLGLRTNPARNPQGGNPQLINCFSEEQGDDAKSPLLVYSTEGLSAFGSALAGGGVRAMLPVGDSLYAVVGRNVYAVGTSGVGVLIGGIASDGPVYMARNRRDPPQIGVVSDGLYYVIDTLGKSVTQILDPDLPSPISFSVLDGYGIIPTVGGEFYLTGIDEFTTIDGLDVGTAEAYPDEIVRSMVLERELVLLGQDSIEFFQNTGDADFPFTRSHATETGCLSGDSASIVDTPTRKPLIWVAPDHTVRLMNGYSSQVISTNEIEDLIKAVDVAGNAATLKGFAWAHAGRFFYALTSASFTRVFDSKTGHWHTRQSYGLNRWRVSAVAPFANKIIAGDYDNGQLYVMNFDTRTEAGNHLVRSILSPPVHAFPYRLQFNGLFVDAATGVGTNSTDSHASDPQLMISWSDDGGYSFSTERTRALGTTAEYKRIQPIYRLGRTGQKGRIFKFSVSSPVESLLISASVDFDRLGA